MDADAVKDKPAFLPVVLAGSGYLLAWVASLTFLVGGWPAVVVLAQLAVVVAVASVEALIVGEVMCSSSKPDL